MAQSGSGAQSYLAVIKQDPATPRTIPATPALQKINFISDSLGMKAKTKKSKHIRNDRMSTGVTLTGFDIGGGYPFEFQYENSKNDELLAGALMAQSWSTPIVDADISAGTFTIAGAVLDLSGAVVKPTIINGQCLKISGTTTNGENDGFYQFFVTGAANVYTVVPPPAANETFAVGVVANGSMIRNGSFKQPFYLERGHTDIAEYFKFLGMVVDKFSLDFKDQTDVTGNFDFVGLDLKPEQATETGAVYTDVTDTPVFSTSTNLKEVFIDGVKQEGCFIKDFDFTLDNKITAKTGLGIYGACDTTAHQLNIAGKIKMYFENTAMFEKFKAGTPFALRWTVMDANGHGYIFTLPRLQLSDDKINVKDVDSDIFDDGAYIASADNVTGCMIQIDKF